jgi:zinc D-Ala-D-Ala carboxypeptidase
MNEQLSKHFTLNEFTKSSTAIRLGIDNTPYPTAMLNLKALAEKVLEPVRKHYGIPFSPTSGFRSSSLNKAIGGSTSSQHRLGQAVDFEVPGISNYELALWIQNNLDFDQLILEFYTPGVPNSGWVHVSYTSKNHRKEVLTAVSKNGKVQYLKGLMK